MHYITYSIHIGVVRPFSVYTGSLCSSKPICLTFNLYLLIQIYMSYKSNDSNRISIEDHTHKVITNKS